MPSIKNIIIFVAIGLSLVLVYTFFIKGDGVEENLVTESALPAGGIATSTGQPGTLAGEDFLTLLLNVKNIKLDDSIFSNPAFKSLHDSSIILIPDGNEGRPNPFAPIGVDVVVTPPTAVPAPTNSETPAPTETPPAN